MAWEESLKDLDIGQLKELRAAVEVRIREIAGPSNIVRLVSVPREQKIRAIKSVRALTSLSLKMAYDLVMNAPRELIIMRPEWRDAELEELRKLGCIVEEVR